MVGGFLVLVGGDRLWFWQEWTTVPSWHYVRGNFATLNLVERCWKVVKAAANLVSAF